MDRESDDFCDPGTTVPDLGGTDPKISQPSTAAPSALTTHFLEFVSLLAVAESSRGVADAVRQIVRAGTRADDGVVAVSECGGVRFLAPTRAGLEHALGYDRLAVADDNPISACIRTGEPLAYDDLDALERSYPNLRPAIEAHGHLSCAVVPLRVNNATIGAVGAWWHRRSAPDADTMSLLAQVASLAGQTLARVQRIEDDRAFGAIAGELSRVADVRDVHRIIATSATKVLPAKSVEIGVVSGGVLLCHVAVGPKKPALERWHRVPLSEPIPATEALRRNEAVIVADERAWARYPNIDATRRAIDVDTLVIEPLHARSMRGVLALSFPATDPYDDRCRNIVSRLVDMASEALDRAELLERELETQRRSRIVRSLTETLPSKDGLGDAVGFAAEQIRELEGATCVSLVWGQPDETDRIERVTISPSGSTRTSTMLDQPGALREAAAGLHAFAPDSGVAAPMASEGQPAVPWFDPPVDHDDETAVFRWGFDLDHFVMLVQIEWQDPAFDLDRDRRAATVADLRTTGRSLHRIALQESAERGRQRTAQLMMGTGTGWWLWEIDTDTIRWSPGVAEMLGSSSDATSLEKALEPLDTDSQRRLQAAIRRAVAEGEEYELELRTKAGRWVWSRAMLSDDPSQPRALMGLIRDITDRKEAVLALEASHDRQRTINRRLQEALLPRSLPTVGGYGLAARYEAAERDLDIGGDWYDAFVLDRGNVAISIGDIVGRGLDAAGATGQLRSVTRATADTAGGPAQVVNAVDRFADSTPGALGASFLYLELDPATGVCEACRAGHMPPILIDVAGRVRLVEEHGSPLLGVGTNRPRPTASFVLEPGDTLLLFTDGLVERPARTLDVGLEQLTQLLHLEPVHPRLETFLEVVSRSMSTDQASSDDLCMVAVRRQPNQGFGHRG